MISKSNELKSEENISVEWDEIAVNRSNSRLSEKDKSFRYILQPKIIERVGLIKKQHRDTIVDVGCGSGELTKQLVKYCNKIVGIDISEKSIEIAKSQAEPSVEFIHSSLRKFAKKNKDLADMCILNMVLSNVNDCKGMCIDIKRLLKKNGKILVTIPHPCYWPEYWNYRNEEWFEYKEQICMTADFVVTGMGSMGKCTHMHRPIEMYFNMLINSGFKIIYVEELFSRLSTGAGDYRYPRFLYIECECEKT